MAAKSRAQQLGLAAELLRIHLPAVLAASDEPLARDLLCAFAIALRAVADDVEASATAWDKRAYHVKADQLRREWLWTQFAIQYAESLATSENILDSSHLKRLSWLVPADLKPAGRRKVLNPEKLRGTCNAHRKRLSRERRKSLKPLVA